MKRSFSPDPFSSAKTAKQVHRCDDDDDNDDGAGRLVDPIPITLSDAFFPNSMKTFHIDPFPVRPKQDIKLYLEEAWGMLKPAIKMIFLDEDEPASFSCTQIIQAVSRACLSGLGRELFHRIRDECEPFISLKIRSLEKQSSSDPSVFLPLVEKCWLDFRRKMMLVSDLSMYETYDGKTLWCMGKGIFQKQLSMASQVEEKIIAGILRLITDERLGKTGKNTTTLLKNLMDMFHEGSDVFEKRFIDSTSDFYAEKSKEVLQESDLSQYMKYAEGVLREEWKKTGQYYFFIRCWIQLMKVVNRELLEVHACVFEKGFTVLMDAERVDDLRRMYGLFSRAGMVGYMDRLLRSYIREEGKGARDGCSLPELMSRIDRVWHRCFAEDVLLDKSIRECFEGLGMHVPGEFEVYFDDYEVNYVKCED